MVDVDLPERRPAVVEGPAPTDIERRGIGVHAWHVLQLDLAAIRAEHGHTPERQPRPRGTGLAPGCLKCLVREGGLEPPRTSLFTRPSS